MTLFVFEGKKREPALFQHLKEIYDIEGEVVCTYQTGIHSLYKEMNTGGFDVDLVPILRDHLHKNQDATLDDYKTSDFGEVYLFFDYDFHDSHNELPQLNKEIQEMLDYFDEETEHGKLYINYPMVESILYTRELPDEQFNTYVVSRKDCKCFKHIASVFSFYSDYSFLSCVDSDTEEHREHIKQNWEYLKMQHVSKANFLCTGNVLMPLQKSDITQNKIFAAQLRKYVLPNEEVAILNSFPLFVFEYLKGGIIAQEPQKTVPH